MYNTISMFFMILSLLLITLLVLLARSGGRVLTPDIDDCDRKFRAFATRHGLEHDADSGIAGNLGAHYLRIEKLPQAPAVQGLTQAGRPVETARVLQIPRLGPILFENRFSLRFGLATAFKFHLQPRRIDSPALLLRGWRIGNMAPAEKLAEFHQVVEVNSEDPSALEAALSPELRLLILDFFLTNPGSYNGKPAHIDQDGITWQCDDFLVDTDHFETSLKRVADIARLLTGLEAGDWSAENRLGSAGPADPSEASAWADGREEDAGRAGLEKSRTIQRLDEPGADLPGPGRTSEATLAWMRGMAVRAAEIDDLGKAASAEPDGPEEAGEAESEDPAPRVAGASGSGGD